MINTNSICQSASQNKDIFRKNLIFEREMFSFNRENLCCMCRQRDARILRTLRTSTYLYLSRLCFESR